MADARPNDIDAQSGYPRSGDAADAISVVVPRDRLDPSERPTWRPSGVRRAALPVDELVYRFTVGDRDGALFAAEALLDRSHVPYIAIAGADLRDLVLDAPTRWLLPFIDGKSPLIAVLEQSGMSRVDALEAFCQLVERGVVELR